MSIRKKKIFSVLILIWFVLNKTLYAIWSNVEWGEWTGSLQKFIFLMRLDLNVQEWISYYESRWFWNKFGFSLLLFLVSLAHTFACPPTMRFIRNQTNSMLCSLISITVKRKQTYFLYNLFRLSYFAFQQICSKTQSSS